jgi:hypothetical protein
MARLKGLQELSFYFVLSYIQSLIKIITQFRIIPNRTYLQQYKKWYLLECFSLTLNNEKEDCTMKKVKVIIDLKNK